MVRGLSQNSRSSAWASKISGGGSISPLPLGADCADARPMPAAGLACATAGGGAATGACPAGLAAALVAACRTLLPDAHPISGTARKLAAVTPKPCCKNSLRDAIDYP
ncbi:hypothetical protein RugamoR1_43480 [Rugamonas sp. R1(2021)]